MTVSVFGRRPELYRSLSVVACQQITYDSCLNSEGYENKISKQKKRSEAEQNWVFETKRIKDGGLYLENGKTCSARN